MYCLKCGKQIADDAINCPYCNAKTENANTPFVARPTPATNTSGSDSLGIASIILGGIGIVMGLMIALLGYIFGGIALTLSIIGKNRDSNPQKANIGLVLSIITLVITIINSILGALMMM